MDIINSVYFGAQGKDRKHGVTFGEKDSPRPGLPSEDDLS